MPERVNWKFHYFFWNRPWAPPPSPTRKMNRLMVVAKIFIYQKARNKLYTPNFLMILIKGFYLSFFLTLINPYYFNFISVQLKVRIIKIPWSEFGNFIYKEDSSIFYVFCWFPNNSKVGNNLEVLLVFLNCLYIFLEYQDKFQFWNFCWG